MTEGERAALGDPIPGEVSRSPFRAEPDPDPGAPSTICRFLLVEGPAGAFAPATGGVDHANRCVTLGEPVPQSSRQQELVCLAAAHVNCPRYLRGMLVAGAPLPPPKRDPISPAVIAATLVLVAALAASFGFLAIRGGFNLPAVIGSPGARRRHRQPIAGSAAERDGGPDSDRIADHVGGAIAERGPDDFAVADGGAHRDADTDVPAANAEPESDRVERPLRPPHEVPVDTRLLDLRHPLRGQPAQHRQLVRRVL